MTSRRTVQRPEQDLADMGTAFGLDASMGLEPEPAPPAPRQAAQSPPPKMRGRPLPE